MIFTLDGILLVQLRRLSRHREKSAWPFCIVTYISTVITMLKSVYMQNSGRTYIKKDSIYCIKVMGLLKVGFFLLCSSIMLLYALIKYLVNKGLIVCLPLPIFATFVGIF